MPQYNDPLAARTKYTNQVFCGFDGLSTSGTAREVSDMASDT
jgi:hypothetical protein